jgi:hypothetical protein
MSQIIRATFSPSGLPREDREGRQVGTEIHVRLLDADEAFDRGAVEHDFAVQRVRELTIGDLDVLDGPEDVGELETQELHLLLLGTFEDGDLYRVLGTSSSAT